MLGVKIKSQTREEDKDKEGAYKSLTNTIGITIISNISSSLKPFDTTVPQSHDEAQSQSHEASEGEDAQSSKTVIDMYCDKLSVELETEYAKDTDKQALERSNSANDG